MTCSREQAALLEIPGFLESGISVVMDQVKEAEEEIRRMSDQYPLMALALHDSFSALLPTVYLRGKSRLYRPHVIELLTRVVKGEELRDPTAAEMLGLISEASLVAVPTSVGSALYFRLFREIFPEQEDLFEETAQLQSSVTKGEYGRYVGDVEELTEKLRRRMRREIKGIKGRS